MGSLTLTLLTLAVAAPSGEDLGALLFPTVSANGDSATATAHLNGDSGNGLDELTKAGEAGRQRQAQLDAAHTVIANVTEAMAAVSTASTPESKEELRTRLEELATTGLEGAGDALSKAIALERDRITLVEQALSKASEDGIELKEIDSKLLERMRTEVGSDKPNKLAASRIEAYRHMTNGLIQFLNADYGAAVEQMQTATEVAPDLAQAYVYLGSFCFLTRKRTRAIRAWRRALELSPNDDELRRALEAIED